MTKLSKFDTENLNYKELKLAIKEFKKIEETSRGLNNDSETNFIFKGESYIETRGTVFYMYEHMLNERNRREALKISRNSFWVAIAALLVSFTTLIVSFYMIFFKQY
jgi:hypothetical protein